MSELSAQALMSFVSQHKDSYLNLKIQENFDLFNGLY